MLGKMTKKNREVDTMMKSKIMIKIVRAHRSVFKRQVFEEVRIQRQREKHNILNSKSKSSRCALPRLKVKLGEAKESKKEKEHKEKEEKETKLNKRIKKIKKI